MALVDKSSLKFLKDVIKNNNREWFTENKEVFQIANNNMKEFLAALETEMNKSDVIEKTKLFRIYRDVRFSKDKTPYTGHFSMSMSREGAFRRGGYYLRIKPQETIIACGFWAPEASDMKLIRDHISSDPKPLRKILNSKKLIDTFGQLEGEQLKNAPRGYDANHPEVDLLKYKQFFLTRSIPDKMVTDPIFFSEIIKTYKAARPFFDYMTDILTHDLNGGPIYS